MTSGLDKRSFKSKNKMKHLAILSFMLLFGFCSVSGLRCWECENAFGGQEECLRTGKSVLCRPDQEFCELHLRHGGDKTNKPFMAKTCKTRKACTDNTIQNARNAWASDGEQVQCNEHFPSSVCRCCCSEDLCNKFKKSCQVIYNCPPLDEVRGAIMSCTDKNNLGSTCSFECKRPMLKKLVGAPSLHCDELTGIWSHPLPSCQRIRCHPLKNIEFGTATCTNGNKYLSECSFTCERGYRLFPPARTIKCIPDQDDDMFGLWSGRVPECIPLQCRKQTPVFHGEITCTNENFVGSVCTLTCVEGYEIYPEGSSPSVRCLNTEAWNQNMSCCTQPCPPHAIMDLVVVLDSSSSVGQENWIKMKRFVYKFISQFAIQDDATHVAVIRYNERVDLRHQIFLDSYPNDKAGLLSAFNETPYDGTGTRTGNALRYTTNRILNKGNRLLARDVVLLITDGISTDPVAIPARLLRNKGALVYVVPIQANEGDINLRQMEVIAGDKENVLLDAVAGGFEALNEDFSEVITNLLCFQPCFNPFHNHPDHALPDHDHDHDHL